MNNIGSLNDFERRRISAFFRLLFCLSPGLAIATGFIISSQAQSLSSSSDPLDNSPGQVNWISGPQKASLGEWADIQIPSGYRLSDAESAGLVLNQLKYPVPDGLVGVLISDSGKWWAILQFKPMGYVKNADQEEINPVEILKAVRNQNEGQNTMRAGEKITSLDWGSVPAYDAHTHSMEWSLQVKTPAGIKLSEVLSVLGRRGVLEAMAAQPCPIFAGSPSLKQFMGNIAFKEGQRYDDYQTGDKVAEIGLTDLIVGKKSPAGLMAWTRALPAFWCYFAVGGSLVLGSAVLVHKLRRRRKPHVASDIRTELGAYARAAEIPPKKVAANVPVLSMRAPANPPATNHTATHSSEKSASRHRRKRVFDYSRFYTNVMTELSFHPMSGNFAGANGKRNPANGHANGHVNGKANGSAAPKNNELDALLVSQRNLIDEQRCLMQQQSRLIEERRWLIEEQREFLKKRSQIIDEQQYSLKLD